MSLNTKQVTTTERLGRSDLPRTEWSVSFGLPKALISTFNYARMYPAKMNSLKTILEFILERIYQWEEQNAEIGAYKKPELRVDTAVTRVIGTDGKPQKVIVPEVPGFAAGERQAPIVPEVRKETARVAPATAPMVPQKAWLQTPESTVVEVPVVEEEVIVPSIPSIPPTPQVGVVMQAPVQEGTIPSIPSIP